MIRDKHSLRMLVLVQVLEFLMLAWIDPTVRNLPIVIVDQDQSVESRQLVDRLAVTPTFELAYATTSTRQAREHLRAGRAQVALVIPPDFSEDRAAGGSPQVLALLDGSDAMTSGQALSAIRGVASRMNVEAQQELIETPETVTLHTTLLYNPEGRLASFVLPGLLAMLLGAHYCEMSMSSLTQERDAGNLERLLMTPMSYTALILGKLVPYFGLGIVNGVIYLLVIRFGFDVPIRGSVVLLMATLTLYVLTSISYGTFIGAGRSGGEAKGLWQILIFPAFWLSGYIFPLASLPKVFLPLCYLLPETHFIEIMRGICLRNASATDLLPDLVYLIIAPTVLVILAARRFSRSILQ